MLSGVGFQVAPLISLGEYTTQELLALRDGESQFSSLSPREGIFLKNSDNTARYKMVSPWFKSDDDWNKKPLVRNECEKHARN